MLLLTTRLEAQDHPVNNNVKILPFQQDASDNTDDKIAMQFYQARDFEKAGEIYGRLYEKKPDQNYYVLYLYCLLEIRDYKKAEKLIKSQTKNDPGSLRYMVDLGYLYYRQGNPDKSKKLYDEALKKLTSSQQQIFELANAFIMRDENDYAIATYKRGRELNNNSYPFSFELASVYERMGDFKSMLEEYIRLLENNKSYLQTIEDRLQFSLAYDPDNSRNEAFRKYILEKAQKEPDKPWYAELLWWYSVQQK
ncbi:MAG: tetratricopeptide repeat protein, partial [Syntrophothermus sp.]